MSLPFCLLFFLFYLNINPCSCWSAVDCEIEEVPDRSIIVEGLQQWGDRSLARKHVAQKADKWNLIQIQTDRQAWTDFLSISPPAVPGFQTTDIPNIWMLTQQMQNEWHTLLYKGNHVNLLWCFSHSYCTTRLGEIWSFVLYSGVWDT